MTKKGKKSKIRMIDGKPYKKRSTHSKKSVAQKKATQIRKTKMNVRIVPTKTVNGKRTWTLYEKPARQLGWSKHK